MEIKVVRKLEELVGLENGCGLYLNYNKINKTVQVYSEKELKIETKDLDWVKGMGFKFRVIRTIKEVLEEMRRNSLDPHIETLNLFEVNCEYNRDSEKETYAVHKNIYSTTLGAYVFDEKTAQKYADELNEILHDIKDREAI